MTDVTYFDIGHTGSNSVLWTLVDNVLLTFSAIDYNHGDKGVLDTVAVVENIKSNEVNPGTYWSGRYDGDVGAVSILPPDRLAGSLRIDVPRYVKAILEKEFPSADVFMLFPHSGSGKPEIV